MAGVVLAAIINNHNLTLFIAQLDTSAERSEGGWQRPGFVVRWDYYGELNHDLLLVKKQGEPLACGLRSR